MNKIELKFKNKISILKPRFLLFDKKTSLEFIEECRIEDFKILGIDGFFHIKGEIIQPSIDNSLDFSWPIYKDISNTYDASIDFLNSRPDNLFFEIVCRDNKI